MVTIAGRFVERSAGPITMPWAASIDIICLVYWVFNVVPAASAPAGASGRRLGAARLKTGGAAFDQTLPVHSKPFLTNSPPAPQPPQRRRPGAVALRGGSRR
jgi:hypothetical protein